MRTPSTDECPNEGHIFHFLRETPNRKNGKLYSFSSCDQTSYKTTTYEKRSLFRLKVCHGRESMVAGTGGFWYQHLQSGQEVGLSYETSRPIITRLTPFSKALPPKGIQPSILAPLAGGQVFKHTSLSSLLIFMLQ